MKTITEMLHDRAAEYRRWDRICRWIDGGTKIAVVIAIAVVAIHVAPQAIREAAHTAAVSSTMQERDHRAGQ